MTPADAALQPAPREGRPARQTLAFSPRWEGEGCRGRHCGHAGLVSLKGHRTGTPHPGPLGPEARLPLGPHSLPRAACPGLGVCGQGKGRRCVRSLRTTVISLWLCSWGVKGPQRTQWMVSRGHPGPCRLYCLAPHQRGVPRGSLRRKSSRIDPDGGAAWACPWGAGPQGPVDSPSRQKIPEYFDTPTAPTFCSPLKSGSKAQPPVPPTQGLLHPKQLEGRGEDETLSLLLVLFLPGRFPHQRSSAASLLHRKCLG